MTNTSSSNSMHSPALVYATDAARERDGWRAGRPVEDPEKTKSWGFITAKPSEYLIHVRGGQIRRATTGQGASCFKRPWDSIAIVPTTIQRLGFEADQVTKEKVGVRITGLAVYRIVEPEIAFRMLNFSFGERANEKLAEILREMLVGATRRLVANLSVEDAMTRRKEGIAGELSAELAPVLRGAGKPDDATDQGWGVVLDSVEVQDVRVLSEQVFANMQATFRTELAARARLAELRHAEELAAREAASRKAIEEARLEADQAVRQLKSIADTRAAEVEIEQEELRARRKSEAERERVVREQAARLEALRAKTEADAVAIAEAQRKARLEADAERERIARAAELELLERKAKSDAEAQKLVDVQQLARLRADAERERIARDAELEAVAMRNKAEAQTEESRLAQQTAFAELARRAAIAERQREATIREHEAAFEAASLEAERERARTEAEAQRAALEIEAMEARRRRELELERLAGEVANAVAAGRRLVEETVSEERIRLTLVEKGLPKIAEAFAQSFGEIKLTQIGGPGQDPMTMVAGAFERIVDVGRLLGLGAQASTPPGPAAEPSSRG